MPVEVTLTYNSDRRLVTSRFGTGWNLSYNIRFVEDAAGNVTIVWGDGRSDTFAPVGGGFAAPAGIHLVLDSPTPGELRLTNPGGLELLFAEPGHRKLTGIRDPNSNLLTLEYDSAGRLAAIHDPTGRSYPFHYDDGGMLASVTDPGVGRTVVLEYDADGRLTAITDPLGNAERFAYSAENLLTQTEDRRGNLTSLSYWSPQAGSTTRLPQSIIKSGNEMQFDFYDASRTTIVTDPNGADWSLAYDGSDRLASHTSPYPVQATTGYAWDGDGNLIGTTDPNGVAQTFAYDALGRLTMATMPLTTGVDAVSQFVWHPDCSRPTSITDPRGNTWTLTYDAGCNLVRIDDPIALGTFEARTVDGSGQTESVTDRSGRTTTFTFDAHGNPQSLTDPAGGTTSFAFDAVGRLLEAEDAVGRTFSYTWDAADRLVATTDGLGFSDALEYDAAGNLTEYTDREGNTTQYAYDALGRLTSVVDASGAVDARAFDDNGNLVTYTDRRGNDWLQTFDAANRLYSRSNPLGDTWLYAYDAAGNLVSHVDARGQATSLTYDRRGRPVRRVYQDGNRTELTWDANGNLLSASDWVAGGVTPYSSLAYDYDAANRRASYTDVALARTVAFGRDGEGRVTSQTDGAGGAQAHTYDAAGRPGAMAAYGGGATFTYDDAGHLVLDQRSSGAGEAYTYDANGRIKTIEIRGPSGGAPVDALAAAAGPVLASYDYTRDANGRIVSVVRESGEMVAFTLDGLGRVVEEQGTLGGAYTLTMTYDPSGNRLSDTLTSAGGTIAGTSVFDAAHGLTSRIVQDGPTLDLTTIIRDANGARATAILPGGATRAYSRDARNRVTAIGEGGATTHFDYDPFDRIVRRASGSAVTDFFFPAAPLILENGVPRVAIAALPQACAAATPHAGRPLVGIEGSARFDLFPAGNTSFPVGGFTTAVAALPNGAPAFGNDNYANGNDRKPESLGDGIWMPTNFAFGLQLPLDWVWVPINRPAAGGDPGNQQPVDPTSLDPLTRGPGGAAVDPGFESFSRRLTLFPGSVHWMLLPEEAVTGAPVLCGSGEPTVPVPPGLFNDLMPTQPVPPGMFSDLMPLQPVPPGTFNDLMPRPGPYFLVPIEIEPLRLAPSGLPPGRPGGGYWFFDRRDSAILDRLLTPPPDTSRFWVFASGLTGIEYRLELRNETPSVIKVAPDVPGPGGGR